ncbi:methylthioribulose 1-phosphate dehydratase [Streptomyces sp. NPDC127079]|uniref:methylthioribulose 1-phosphate dehydratase n=1 Tax=Streptomyces sp. NPDC127079 TaxID=3347132 RepID=UPI003664BE1D
MTPPGAPGHHEEAAELAALARALYLRGWMPGTSGNLSVRLAGGDRDKALITASGLGKGELAAEHMVVVGAESGATVLAPDGLKASAETSIHSAVYRTTGAGAVIHVHAPYSTVVACRAGDRSRRTTLELTHFELLKGLGLADPSGADVPVFPNWPDVPRIATEVAEYLTSRPQASPGLLIVDHGITVWGGDLAEARNRLECFESICQLLTLGAADLRTRPSAPTTTNPITED